MRTLKISSLLLMTLFIITGAIAQDHYKDAYNLGIDNITNNQKVPEASSLTDAGKSDADLYTGRATYNIPLFTLQNRNLKLPISISYCSSGVQVGRLSDWIGMDWNLSVGGEIVREMKGLPDETANTGYFAQGNKVDEFFNDVQTEQLSDDLISEQDKKDLIVNAEKNEIDLQPDIFYFNFEGHSGKFIIDYNNNIYCIPYQFLQITKSVGIDNRINGFEITTKDGTKYTFGISSDAIEETKLSTVSFTVNHPQVDDKFTLQIDDGSIKTKEIPYYTSKWHLSKIESPTNDAITFSYTSNDDYFVEPQRVMSDGWVGNIGYYPDNREGYKKLMQRYHNKYWEPRYPGGSVPAGTKFDPNSYFPDALPLLKSGTLSQWLSPSTSEPFSVLNFLEDLGISGSSTTAEFEARTISNAIRFTISQTRHEIKQKILSSIVASNGNSATFTSDINAVDSPNGVMLHSIQFYNNKNNPVKSFDFGYTDVVSQFYTSDLTDPFSLGEALCFKSVSFPQTGLITPKYAEDVFNNSPYNASLGNYVGEGLKSYNYHHAYLASIQEYNIGTYKPMYEFTYNSPEKLQRRTSNWVDFWGYNNEELPTKNFTNDAQQDLSVTFGIYSDGYPTQNFVTDESSNWIYDLNSTTDAARIKPTNVSQYGLLTEVKTPLGGFIDYSYENNDDKAGCRVEKILSKASANENSLTKTFGYSNSWIAPTAYLKYLDYYEEEGNYADYKAQVRIYKIAIRTSYNQYDINPVNGSYVSYGEVTVSLGNGSEIYSFTNPGNEMGDVYGYPKLSVGTWDSKLWGCTSTSDPTSCYYYYNQHEDKVFFKEYNGALPAPSTSIACSAPYIFNDNSYKGGRLTQVLIKDKNNSTQKTTIYHYVEVPQSSVKSLKTMSYYNILKGEVNYGDEKPTYNPYKKYKAGFYTFNSAWYELDYKTETLDGLTIRQDYTYNSLNGLIEEESFTQSDGLTRRINYHYYIDNMYKSTGYTYDLTDPFTLAVKTMEAKKINSALLEKTEFCNGKIVSAELVKYGVFSGPNSIILGVSDQNNVLPTEMYKIKPISGNGFIPAYFNTQLINGTYRKVLNCNSNYTLESIADFYDGYSNLLQAHKVNGQPTTMLWGYNSTLPIAKADNANYYETFYDGFEDDGTWDSNLSVTTFSHTGKKAGIIYSNGSAKSSHSTRWLINQSAQPKKFKYSGWGYSKGPNVNIYLFMKRIGETGDYSYIDHVSTTVKNQWVFLEKNMKCLLMHIY